MVVQSIHQATLFLTSMETTTSSATQQTKMVVQSLHQTILYLASVEQPTSSVTWLSMVVVGQSTHQTVLHFTSTTELATSSTTQQMVVEVFVQFLTVHRHSMEQFTLLAMDTTKGKQTY